jgi:hypothetical protein
MDFLGEIAELLARMDTDAEPVTAPIQPRRRGRPATKPEWKRPIGQLSPRQLARNDLIDTAYHCDEIVARTRADSLNSGRSARAIQGRMVATNSDRARRISNIALILKDPQNSVWARHPNCKIAITLHGQETFSGINLDTLRKDIAKAKKQNWHATHSD